MSTKRTVSLTRPERDGSHTTPFVKSKDRTSEASGEVPVVKKENSGEKGPPLPPLYRGGRVGGPIPNRDVKSQILDQVRGLVAKLSDADRKALLTELALAEQSKSAPARDLDMWATGVQTALDGAIRGRDGAGVGFLPLRRLLGARSAWAPVEEFMHSTRLDQLTVTERAVAYDVLGELLVDHAHGIARRASIPLTSKFVANCTREIAAIFDQSFPGYAVSGMAPLIVRGRVQS